MPIDKAGEHTYLLTPEQAALDILYALMMADGNADESEFEVIKDFLKTEFARAGSLFNEKHSLFSGTNFAMEYAYLKGLDGKTLRSRFQKAVKSFGEWTSDHPEAGKLKNDIMDFALKLIAADGKLTPEEKELISVIGANWDIAIPQ